MTAVAILGAGPAGLAAARGLADAGVEVTVVERARSVGGQAASFEIAGVRVDHGSHRLHPATEPRVLAELRALLGADLLERPRHGRIRLAGRWIHFPLRPLDLALRLPPAFAASAALDAIRGAVGAKAGLDDSFASVLNRGLGPTICRDFYFPFARKIWGLAPEEISVVQARKRVSASSIGKMLRRILPGGRGGSAPRGVFYYPRRGYGQICERLAEAAEGSGARILLGTAAEEIRCEPDGTFRLSLHGDGRTSVRSAGILWSTIPISALVARLVPHAPDDVMEAARSLETRALVLVYLVLSTGRFTEFDAHYFPGLDVPFTRVSEPKNYSGATEPPDRTVLCAELPCDVGDSTWSAEPTRLAALVETGLADAGLPIAGRVVDVVVRRLPHAYPRYRRGFERHFERVDRWLAGIDGLLTFGRQGLFVHDNTHHALFMAQAAIGAFRPDGRLDRDAWRRAREVFASHVVED